MAIVENERRSEEELTPERLLHDDPKGSPGKIAVFQYLTVAVFVFLISGFWKLQVQNPDFYSEAAERNRIKSTPILAARGKILDRDGRVIVDNKASYSLLLNRDSVCTNIFQLSAKLCSWTLQRWRKRSGECVLRHRSSSKINFPGTKSPGSNRIRTRIPIRRCN